jgi:cyclopropane fatty-acyl-phospholipid synthase-like methyltransferase
MTESTTLPDYTLSSSEVEQERLRRQADDLRPHSMDLFGRLGVQPGWEVLDLGCGPRGNLDLLAGLAGPGGRVTGVDVNPDHVRLAEGLLTGRELDDLDRAARAPIEAPGTVMLPMLYFTTWGRKPG